MSFEEKCVRKCSNSIFRKISGEERRMWKENFTWIEFLSEHSNRIELCSPCESELKVIYHEQHKLHIKKRKGKSFFTLLRECGSACEKMWKHLVINTLPCLLMHSATSPGVFLFQFKFHRQCSRERNLEENFSIRENDFTSHWEGELTCHRIIDLLAILHTYLKWKTKVKWSKVKFSFCFSLFWCQKAIECATVPVPMPMLIPISNVFQYLTVKIFYIFFSFCLY